MTKKNTIAKPETARPATTTPVQDVCPACGVKMKKCHGAGQPILFEHPINNCQFSDVLHNPESWRIIRLGIETDRQGGAKVKAQCLCCYKDFDGKSIAIVVKGGKR